MHKERSKKKAVFTKQVLVRFSEEEFLVLKDKAKKAGLSHSEFIRRLVRDKEIKQGPPPGFDFLIGEIKSLGNKLNALDNLIIEKNSPQGELTKECKSSVHYASVLLNGFYF